MEYGPRLKKGINEAAGKIIYKKGKTTKKWLVG
jgi:hypothetical protein